MPNDHLGHFPQETDYETFEEFALACSVWIEANPDAILLRCFYGEPILYFDDMEARGPGHIYSYAGQQEYGITHFCEYHFDQITREMEDDEVETIAKIEDEVNGTAEGEDWLSRAIDHIDDEMPSADSQRASKSLNNDQSGDSVSEFDGSPKDSQEAFDKLWDELGIPNDPFEDDDPNMPEPM